MEKISPNAWSAKMDPEMAKLVRDGSKTVEARMGEEWTWVRPGDILYLDGWPVVVRWTKMWEDWAGARPEVGWRCWLPFIGFETWPSFYKAMDSFYGDMDEAGPFVLMGIETHVLEPNCGPEVEQEQVLAEADTLEAADSLGATEGIEARLGVLEGGFRKARMELQDLKVRVDSAEANQGYHEGTLGRLGELFGGLADEYLKMR